jgi:hypothetical protein
VRSAGQTPREFARHAGRQLATASGRPELAGRALDVAEAYYRVRFGREALDEPTTHFVQQVLRELAACTEAALSVATSKSVQGT